MYKLVFALLLAVVVINAQSCSDYGSCTKCNANSTCGWCSSSGATFCINNDTCGTIGGSLVSTCPAVCSDVPTVANAACSYPAGYKVPSNESFAPLYSSCADRLAQTTRNCSAPAVDCDSEIDTLSQACKDALLRFSCFSCFKCDDDFSYTTFSNYVLCDATCDALASACAGQFKNESCNPFNSFNDSSTRQYSCSNNTATCNDLNGVTYTGHELDSCTTSSSSDTGSSSSSDTGSSSSSATGSSSTSSSTSSTNSSTTSSTNTSATTSSSASSTGSGSGSSDTSNATILLFSVFLFLTLLI